MVIGDVCCLWYCLVCLDVGYWLLVSGFGGNKVVLDCCWIWVLGFFWECVLIR